MILTHRELIHLQMLYFPRSLVLWTHRIGIPALNIQCHVRMVLQLGFICAMLSFIQLCKANMQALHTSDLLICENDYWKTIKCFLDSKAILNRRKNITYQLKFKMDNNCQFCSLSAEKDGYSCIFTAKLKVFHSSFVDFHTYDISLCELDQCKTLNPHYIPSEHIKPLTPYNVMVQYENGTYSFSWSSGYEEHKFVEVLPFRYILRYHQVGQSDMKELHTRTTVFNISETHFDPGTEYVAKVYNKIIPSNKYNGTTSHGSTEVRWKTPPEVTSVERSVILICLAFLIVGLLLLLIFPVARMKIKKISRVKTPAPYIPPLNHTTQGYFQFWLSKDHVQQIYTEEISTIDMVTEIKPKQQLQEHIPAMISQGHTPYVGPLMEVWAPCQMPDTHITANNLSNNLNFLSDDCEVEEALLCLSMPKTVEKFVSLDDLEPSDDICKPSEALTITPHQGCFAQNYCTLTNTAIGLIPTFCQVQHVPSLVLGINGHTSPDLLNMQMEENTPELDTVTLENLQLSLEE